MCRPFQALGSCKQSELQDSATMHQYIPETGIK